MSTFACWLGDRVLLSRVRLPRRAELPAGYAPIYTLTSSRAKKSKIKLFLLTCHN